MSEYRPAAPTRAACRGCEEMGYEAMKDAHMDGVNDPDKLRRIANAAMKAAGSETMRLRALYAESPAMAEAEGVALVSGFRARMLERAKAIRDAASAR